jgi:bifunctional UDP-N-acetylglucosamine pyrophosphorylase/glucosamine-1-phosphate N-acetyltransferase
MKAVILAAGKGKRMRPLTETRLKGSLPVLNKPLLVYLSEMIARTNLLDELILVISPDQKEEILSLFANEPFADKIRIAIQDPPKGTADAVAQAEPFVTDEDKVLLVLNGDIFAPLEEIIPKLLAHHKKRGAVGSVVGLAGESERYGLMKFSATGELLEIKEKVKEQSKAKSKGYINCGIYLFSNKIFDAIRATPLSERGEYEITDSIDLLSKQGPIAGFEIDTWISMENPTDLFKAQTFLKPDTALTNMQFHSGGEIGFKAATDLYVEVDEELAFSSAKIIGPTLIGEGTLVETGAQLGPNVFLGRDCEIGAETKIANSLLMDNCRIGSKCQLKAIITAEDVVLGDKIIIQPKQGFVVIGGKAILASGVQLKKEQKISAHAAVTTENTK